MGWARCYSLGSTCRVSIWSCTKNLPYRRHNMLRAKNGSTISCRIRPTLEALEDRCLLTANVLQTNLVSDLPGVAKFQDANLVNPWGISESSGSPFWISDNNAGVTSLYNTAGTPQALVVSI